MDQTKKMKIAITGHTKGIGLEIFKYFEENGHECRGFSKSTGYDIRTVTSRERMLTEIRECDIFINNACTIDDSQFILLKSVYQLWRAQKKIIINVSSRAADFANVANSEFPFYAALKAKQDNFCRTKFGNPWIINLKPGTVATDSNAEAERPKMKVESITRVLDFIFSNSDEFKVRSITFTPW